MIEFSGITVSQDSSPFIIAEMSGNHNQSLDRALDIVDAAANAGVDAIKLQTYTADTITIDSRNEEFLIRDDSSLWNGHNLYELYNEAHTPWDWHKPIMERAALHGLVCFSSPFDPTSVEFLEDLNVPIYKIASPELVDLPLIKCVAETGKPMIVSTGMGSLQEIAQAVDTIYATGNRQLVLLKCTSTYPATPENTNIRTIPHLREMFQCEVGLSDHTMGIGTSIAAVTLGATVIEKHFTLKRSDGGVDSAFSMEPDEMQSLVVEMERARKALGKVSYGPMASEIASLNFRRSLYVIHDLIQGDTLTNENCRSIRPSKGLSPKYLEIVLGKKVNQDISKGTALNWDMIH